MSRLSMASGSFSKARRKDGIVEPGKFSAGSMRLDLR
jgi:hypothetical protein